MVRIATSTCSVCHQIKPRTEMRQVTQRVKSGTSFGGSFNPKKQNSTRYSARAYYRDKTVWICKSCPASDSEAIGTLIIEIIKLPFTILGLMIKPIIKLFPYFVTFLKILMGFILISIPKFAWFIIVLPFRAPFLIYRRLKSEKDNGNAILADSSTKPVAASGQHKVSPEMERSRKGIIFLVRKKYNVWR